MAGRLACDSTPGLSLGLVDQNFPTAGGFTGGKGKIPALSAALARGGTGLTRHLGLPHFLAMLTHDRPLMSVIKQDTGQRAVVMATREGE